MPEEIIINGQKIEYTKKISVRAKALRLSVYHDGTCVLTVPKRASAQTIQKFLYDKSDWVIEKVSHFKSNPRLVLGKGTKRELALHKEHALALALSRLEFFNHQYGFTWKNIAIRNQSTRWGSCSKAGSLSFNYKIVDLPARLFDYVIVHELCHLKEMNHSDRFWSLVAHTMPEYRELRKQLRAI